jgi:hypothetical protein
MFNHVCIKNRVKDGPAGGLPDVATSGGAAGMDALGQNRAHAQRESGRCRGRDRPDVAAVRAVMRQNRVPLPARAPRLKYPEWVLFYRQGVSAEQIARLTGRPVAQVRNYLTRIARQHPNLVAGRLYLHDRPLPPPAGWVDRDRGWKRRLGELTRFMAEHGRRPQLGGDEAGEGQTAHWLTMQRSAYKTGRLPGHRARWLDEALPAWQTDTRTLHNDAAWRLHLAAVVAFRAEHGRWPKRGGAGGEHKLGRWLALQRHRARSEEQRRALDSQLPGWVSPLRSE